MQRVLHQNARIDGKPPKTGVCKGTSAPALYGASELRLRRAAGLPPKAEKPPLSTASFLV
jgi:hypothetical protein